MCDLNRVMRSDPPGYGWHGIKIVGLSLIYPYGVTHST